VKSLFRVGRFFRLAPVRGIAAMCQAAPEEDLHGVKKGGTARIASRPFGWEAIVMEKAYREG